MRVMYVFFSVLNLDCYQVTSYYVGVGGLVYFCYFDVPEAGKCYGGLL